MTTPLYESIAEDIAASGPMTIERFWQIALFDRKHGYYSAREPFGRSGDFTTAPEISQMFGELIGAWIAGAWDQLRRPSPFLLTEIGPGRGTLMADIVRTLRSAAPACLAAARIRLVETSERLAALQAVRLEPFDLPIRRVRRIGEIEDLPMILVANELFDAVPIRQVVRHGGRWHERMVGLGEAGRLAFLTGRPAGPLPAWLIAGGRSGPDEGTIAEFSPAREGLAAEISQRIARQGGAGLFIDYGHARSAVGDSFQAVREHAFVPVLDDPGEADLTSHVDFSAISQRFSACGNTVSPIETQGAFLLRMGLLERAGALGARLDEAGREAIRNDVQRLAGSGEGDMGALFKVVAAAHSPLTIPPFAAPAGD
ncbi:SAM-dependent methyltransferase [Fulvimarina sp. 2208YS6-2-32]|uniref:SAM-dependent methyltransferase n=1 Tax=Fulvimarina uroteuthidis TaxID=3098149 RepID=A0ABU5I3X3_9HYPH|nr:SAM-dependent methyltransferase [Fulvimarina sp. 2208YS6-2-32]MDY8110089.1 SAM-dependent methyltransferase [Fulvimarina sp. 2208YS6-2-32]